MPRERSSCKIPPRQCAEGTPTSATYPTPVHTSNLADQQRVLLAAVRRHGRRRRTERDCQQETVADVAGRPSASSRHSTSGHDPPRQRLPHTFHQKGAAKQDPTHVSNPRSEILQKHSTQPTNSDKNTTPNALTDNRLCRVRIPPPRVRREWGRCVNCLSLSKMAS